MAEGGAADVETQRAEIAALLKTPLRRADTWFLVDSRWFKLWRKFVGFDSWDRQQTGQQSAYPGPVDNSGLLSGVSVTFDPFCYLTLPLPMKKECTLEVFMVWLDPLAKHTQYKVTVPKVGQISDLCASLSALCDVPPEKMVVTDIYNHRFHRFFSSNENLSSIMERDDIYVFELSVSRQEDPEHLLVPVHLREKYKQSGFNQTSTPLFGLPFLLRVPHTLTEEKLYNLLLLRLRRFIRADTEDCKDASSPKHCSVNGSATNGTAEECSPSEMELDEPDEEPSVEQGVSSESDSSSPAEEQRLENGPSLLENGPSLLEPCRRLFSLQITNMGKTDGGALLTGEPHAQIHFQEERLSDKCYLSLVWEPEMKRSFFNQAAVEDFEKHHSMDYKPQKKMSCQLRDCIQLFTTKEKLGADDPWYCPSCKQHQQATKQLDLWSLPPVLVVHLKRFSYSRYMRDKLDTLVEFPLRYTHTYTYTHTHSYSRYMRDKRDTLVEFPLRYTHTYTYTHSYSRYIRDKLDTLVEFPLRYTHIHTHSYSRYMRDKLDTLVEFPLRDLDMSEFLINPHAGVCRYDLIAVSNHYGGMGGGHYTAYAKNVEDDQWYSFDDSSVSPASEEQIVSKAAYVLFYQRQDTVRGTGYFALDREPPADKEEEEDEDEEDVNDSEQDEDLQPSPDVSMSTS
ncbi:ubiquitin carboxyl-terminal hydrolase 15 [Danio aesculapii]|uniref:ubiquitin carboxyl-terminal hydrolase 15 n=1 Tax=Danio aesculapii TaxID=1142201 RepID=UPI0024BFB75A|nr:ubiquitin carboxyl-terminal hydrolase 15 [Danio aesculapii]